MSFVDTRLKIRRTIKKYRKIIIFIVIAWVIIFMANYILKNRPTEELPKTTYEPNIAVMTDDEVPEKYHATIESTIDTFVNKCNDKDYEGAYNMLSDDCRNEIYPNLDGFKQYVDSRYPSKRAYSIQNFSNVGNQYIYNVNLMEDIMATGLTGKEYGTLEEKFVFTENDDELKLSIDGFVRKQNLNVVAEDENLKIDIDYKNVFYDHEIYVTSFTNRSEHPIVLADGSSNNEISLNIGTGDRSERNVGSYGIVLQPGETKSYNLSFSKYCDDGNAPQYLMLNAVRVLQSYSGDENLRDAELANAIRIYTLKINFPTK